MMKNDQWSKDTFEYEDNTRKKTYCFVFIIDVEKVFDLRKRESS